MNYAKLRRRGHSSWDVDFNEISSVDSKANISQYSLFTEIFNVLVFYPFYPSIYTIPVRVRSSNSRVKLMV